MVCLVGFCIKFVLKLHVTYCYAIPGHLNIPDDFLNMFNTEGDV